MHKVHVDSLSAMFAPRSLAVWVALVVVWLLLPSPAHAKGIPEAWRSLNVQEAPEGPFSYDDLEWIDYKGKCEGEVAAIPRSRRKDWLAGEATRTGYKFVYEKKVVSSELESETYACEHGPADLRGTNTGYGASRLCCLLGSA